MGDFLTSSATLMCPHGGTVTGVASDTHITFGGDPVVLASDTFTIAGCAFAPGGAPHPCVTLEWQVTAAKSTATGNAKLTTDSVGMCKAADGAVQGAVTIQATQTKAGGL
jgi:hypothetical protein